MTMDAARHEQQHAGLDRMQERIDHIEEVNYLRAKARKDHAPRKFARLASRSQRVSQIGAWRAHLYAHGVKNLGPFMTLDELKARHSELHHAISAAAS
jgi:hypothetical protein